MRVKLLIFASGKTKECEISECPRSDLLTEYLHAEAEMGQQAGYNQNNVRLLKQMQDKVTEMNPELQLVLLRRIIGQEVLCKSARDGHSACIWLESQHCYIGSKE